MLTEPAAIDGLVVVPSIIPVEVEPEKVIVAEEVTSLAVPEAMSTYCTLGVMITLAGL